MVIFVSLGTNITSKLAYLPNSLCSLKGALSTFHCRNSLRNDKEVASIRTIPGAVPHSVHIKADDVSMSSSFKNEYQLQRKWLYVNSL